MHRTSVLVLLLYFVQFALNGLHKAHENNFWMCDDKPVWLRMSKELGCLLFWSRYFEVSAIQFLLLQGAGNDDTFPK